MIAVALCEFLGRAFETANENKEKKVFNFETHTYDSVKNGRLNNDKTRAIVITESNDNNAEKLTTQTIKKNNTTKNTKTQNKKGANV